MSSVTRFIRQVPLSTTYYSVPSGMSSTGAGAYELSAPSLGNYADSGVYMAGASAKLISCLQLAVAASGAGGLVLRDMGKTIRCPYGSASGALTTFRQVQLLSPSVSLGQSLGAADVPSSTTDFFTFYIPSVIGGATAAAVQGGVSAILPSLAVPIVGGQM